MVGQQVAQCSAQGIERFLGEMSINCRGDRTAMAEEFLDNTEINGFFQKIGGIRMPQGVNQSRLVDPAFAESILECPLQHATAYGAVFLFRRKQPVSGAEQFPVTA